MRKLSFAMFFLLILGAPGFAGQFTGTLELNPEGCAGTGECTIGQDFGFVDEAGIGWEAKRGLKTDGASIPAWAQPFVGGAFDKEFIQAAVIHDHYCNRHVRSWKSTHRVFYDALVTSGVDKAKAMLMYYAVYLGGPKWSKLIEGTPCQVGKMCIRRLPNQVWPAGASEQTSEDGQQYVVRKSEYHLPLFAEQLNDANKFIAEQGPVISLLELEQRAEAIKPGDFFYAHQEIIAVRAPGAEKQ